jgi:hypothetical protein
MEKNKTVETDVKVSDYLKTIKDESRYTDCLAMVELITMETGLFPKMWGPSIIGFGSYHYKYESGREGDAPLVGISSRSNAIACYLSAHFENREELLQKLGKHQTDKGCIYIKKFTDIDPAVFSQILKNQIKHVRELYPVS